MPLSAGANFAGYTIVRLLGAGGMGEVYLVRHPRLNRHDALKILPTALAADANYRRRFDREADLAASLWHPNIVGVHDRGEFDGQLWISMDYVNGTDAAALCRDHYPTGMPRDEVTEIAAGIGAALDFAHERGLLHRDVKPANILLTEPHVGLRRILLADFGIARDVNDANRLTATNMTLGTISYTAPEQLSGEKIDGRADQYALAATAYRLLTGVGPFDDPSPAVVISRQLYALPPTVSATHPQLADLDVVFARALAKDPAQRFPTCRDFAAALRGGASHSSPQDATQLAGNQPAAPPWYQPPAASQGQPTPSPAAPRSSGSAALIAGLMVLGLLFAGVLVWLGFSLAGPDRTRTATAAAPATSTLVRAAPPTVTGPAYLSTPQPAAAPPRILLPDADEQGFLVGGARCAPGDRAALMIRTANSTAVVCTTPSQQLYYRGARDSDGATIELAHVERTPSGFVAINDVDPTRYEVTYGGLRIVHQGQVVSAEPALESAP
ncbi:MAG: protein kinase [Mycobacterium sp.]